LFAFQDGLQLDAEAIGLYQINITGTQSAAGLVQGVPINMGIQ